VSANLNQLSFRADFIIRLVHLFRMPLADILRALPSLTEAERQSLLTTALDLTYPPRSPRTKSPSKKAATVFSTAEDNSALPEELVKAASQGSSQGSVPQESEIYLACHRGQSLKRVKYTLLGLGIRVKEEPCLAKSEWNIQEPSII
jgi:hypothetical protein